MTDSGGADLAAQLAELRAWTQRVEGDVADLSAQLQAVTDDLADARAQLAAGGGAGIGPSDADVEKYAPLYDTLDAWVEQWFTQVYRRAPTNTWRWCPAWWDHPEAVHRLEALHRAWEVARHDPNGRNMLAWQRDCDQTLAMITDPAGAFAACTVRDHRPNHPLPLIAAKAHRYEGVFRG